MQDFEIVIVALFVSVAGLNAIARWLSVPYPIPLVLGGLALGLVPGMPEIELDPDLVLVVFLPPLLYAAAFFADLRALREQSAPDLVAAVGLVLLTIGAVAVIGHEAIGLSWPLAFALGAIVSPTDPVAATAIMRQLGAPRRLVNVIEGESLVNDATALVALRVAVTAAVGGTFSVLDAGIEFVGAAAGGIAIGLAVGYVVAGIRGRLDDAPTELAISLLTAYAAFIPADELGLSGVLAAVTAGVYLGWRAPELITPQTRLQSFAVWEILVFLLNAALFILIGLQLPVIAEGLDGYSTRRAGRLLGARVRHRDRRPLRLGVHGALPDPRARSAARAAGAAASARMRIVSAWAGMRGAVSLAAALSLPLETDAGAPLPGRDLILFITFALILVTVVGQGLTLPYLIRRLGVREDGEEEAAEETAGAPGRPRAALERLDELAVEDWTLDDTIERTRKIYEFRQRRVKVRAGKIEDEEASRTARSPTSA